MYFDKKPYTSRIQSLFLGIVLSFSLGVVISTQVHAQQVKNPSDDSVPVEYQLANGMRIIVKEDHRSPTVAHMVWYQVGSIDEKSGTTGVAHVLEHMMFKGTKNVPVGEFSKRVAALGGRENAFTNTDYTAYFQQIEKSHLREVMALEADRMQNLVITEEEFKKEIQVVMEERRLRTDDQPTSLLYEQLMATSYQSAPNRHPVIGWMSDLKSMTYTDAIDWYKEWYTPQNAILVVVGDVKPADVLKLAEQTYGQIGRKTLPERKVQQEPEQKGLKRFSLKAPSENAVMYLGWKVPKLSPDNFSYEEPYALDVLSAILDGNSNTRLPRVLVKQKRLAVSVGAGYDSCCDRGEQLFTISVELLDKNKVQQVEQEIRAIIRDIAMNGVSDQELKRVKIAVKAAQVYKRDSVFGQAMELGGALVTGFTAQQMDEWISNLQKVTSAQVQAVAKNYLVDDRLTIGILDPQPIDLTLKAANERAAAKLER